MSSVRRGFLYGLAAYGLWGFFPLYFKVLRPTGPLEILAHRIFWSAVFVALVLLVVRRWRGRSNRSRAPGPDHGLRRLARHRRWLGLAAAPVLIGVNWGTFIYGVNSDRVVEVSLGYFITPLVTVLLGVFVLRERLRGWQWLALAIGTAAVTVLTVDYGRLPYVALILAGSFGLYGLVKKALGLPALDGLFVEAALLAAPALGYLAWHAASGAATVGTVGMAHTALILAGGVITAVPLLLFAGAANRVPLSTLGILQYLAPMLQFGLGVFLFHEPMPPARLAGFALVWLALAVFTAEALHYARGGRATRPAAAGVEPGVMEPVRP